MGLSLSNDSVPSSDQPKGKQAMVGHMVDGFIKTNINEANEGWTVVQRSRRHEVNA